MYRPADRTRARLLVTVLTLAGILMAACSAGKDAVNQDSTDGFKFKVATPSGTLIAAADRKLAGPVEGQLLAGGTYALSSDKGRTVVLNFFASWCGPCQNETPQFDTVYRARKASDVNFVGVDVKDPSRSASRAWLENKGITFPVVYDEPGKTALQLGDVPVTTLPQTILIDKSGRVAAVYFAVLLPKDLTNALDKLSKES